ncbi:hypothetical protein TSUD_46410 [Trifolium subterraneum]|uniref:Uncharacterized protein n=1 Tax=Trifolium subterraneum TaxID=3900 RepID=A0A2Z6LW18_TRISU|nr:hypothetical protein TSUD_46410 [Trifolium subterraneum]
MDFDILSLRTKTRTDNDDDRDVGRSDETFVAIMIARKREKTQPHRCERPQRVAAVLLRVLLSNPSMSNNSVVDSPGPSSPCKNNLTVNLINN